RAAEEQGDPQLDPRTRAAGTVDARLRSDDDPRREMLDLALTVDRRIRHDRDGLLEEVREVRALQRERGERTVVAERADGLVRGLLHERRLLQILGVVAERGELLLAPDREVLDLVRHHADLDPAAGPRLRRGLGSHD